jgi:hypothetical protein
VEVGRQSRLTSFFFRSPRRRDPHVACRAIGGQGLADIVRLDGIGKKNPVGTPKRRPVRNAQ